MKVVWCDFIRYPLCGVISIVYKGKGKGKVILLQAQRVGRGIALLFHDRGTRRG